MSTKMFSKNFVIRFRDSENRPLFDTRDLCDNIRSVSPVEYTEEAFGMSCRGKVTVVAYDDVDSLKGIDILAKQYKFTMIINLTDKDGTTVASRWLKDCLIRRVMFGELVAHSCNEVTSTQFLIEFNQFSTVYLDSGGLE